MRIVTALIFSILLHLLVIFWMNGDSFIEAKIPDERRGDLIITLIISNHTDLPAFDDTDAVISHMERELGLVASEIECGPEETAI